MNLLIEDYFGKLFQSGGSDGQEVLECIQPCISSHQNAQLDQDFTGEEVKEALFAMHPDKSPGPDGMNPAFYQRFWNIVGKDVVELCLRTLSTGSMPQNLNDTLSYRRRVSLNV